MTRIVLLEELFVQIDHGVVSTVTGAEVGEEGVDIGDGQCVSEIDEAKVVEIQRVFGSGSECAVHGLEEWVLEVKQCVSL